MYCVEAYSAMYNTDAYQFPAGSGIAESYVKYQMYSSPSGYSAQTTQYGYDDGRMVSQIPTHMKNPGYTPAASTSCEWS